MYNWSSNAVEEREEKTPGAPVTAGKGGCCDYSGRHETDLPKHNLEEMFASLVRESNSFCIMVSP